MRMKHTLISGLMAASLLAIGTGLATASAGELGNHSARHIAYQGGDKPMQHLMERLDLDQAQRDKIETRLKEGRAEMQETYQAMRDIHNKLREATIAEDYTADQVKQLAEQKAGLAAELSVQRAEIFRDIYQFMTPEQQEAFSTMRHKQHRHSG